MDRRRFVRSAALGVPLAGLAPAAAAAGPTLPPAPRDVVRPRRLAPGSHLRLVSPAGVVDQSSVERARARLEAYGFTTSVGAHALARFGYLAGTDRERAADLRDAFLDRRVDGIITTRGGWGCARLLPYFDMDAARANPKALVGFSDVTALLLALYAGADLATFHGPNATSSLRGLTGVAFRQVLMDGARPTLVEEPPRPEPREPLIGPDGTEVPLPPYEPPGPLTTMLWRGRARGRLVGGNLSVLAGLVGTPYLPETRGHILFLEDVGEAIYRMDRMLTHLALAGVFEGVAGVVFGQCRNCDRESPDDFSLEELFRQHTRDLGVPVFMGAAIGHVSPKLTVPLGVEAEIDAEAGTIRLLEAAVR